MLTTIAVVSALVVAALAAVADWRTGQIANWITLPVALGSPPLYALFWSPQQGAVSAVSLVLCGLVPYFLFRYNAMGGGDVKLFAALGAATGFDLRLGLEIELVALLVAAAVAFIALARGRSLWKAVRHLVGSGGRLRHVLTQNARCTPDLLTPIRLGLPVFIGTSAVVLPILFEQWATR